MANTEPDGKPITREDANKYIDGHRILKSCLRNCVLDRITRGDMKSAKEPFEDVVKHYDTDVNGFLFSKEMVMRFFDTSKPQDQQASHLLILLGAKFDADKGKPTVVIAGMNKSAGMANTYQALKIEFPASEQPPAVCEPVLPLASQGGETEFAFTITPA